jgi:hypothetical protein
MEQIERLTVGHLRVGIQDLDFGDETAALERERCARPHPSTAADDRDLHALRCPTCLTARPKGRAYFNSRDVMPDLSVRPA